jgi:hypothetical protein
MKYRDFQVTGISPSKIKILMLVFDVTSVSIMWQSKISLKSDNIGWFMVYGD